MVGGDGATHHGLFDLAYLRCIPNLLISAPRNEIELRNIMYTAQLGLNNPIAIRYPRGRGVILDWRQPFEKVEIGNGVQLKKGQGLAVLSIGSIANTVSEAIKNQDASHYDLRFVKPLDEEMLHDAFKTHEIILTIEDGIIKGGFGSAILEFAAHHRYKNPVKLLGVPDKFIEHGSVNELKASVDLDLSSISDAIAELMKSDI